MKKIVVLFLIAAMVLSFAACGAAPVESPVSTAASAEPSGTAKTGEESGMAATTVEKFILGTFCPLSGSSAEFGQHCLQAVNLWAKQINASGGLLGQYQVEVVAYDDQHSAAEAVPVVTKMLANDNINACVGSQASAAILPVIDLFEEAKIPLVGNGTSPTYMSFGYEYIFRGTVKQDNTIYQLAQTMKDLGIQTVGLFTLQDEAGQTARDAMQTYCEELGITVTTSEYCNTTDTDYSGQVARLIDTKPDALFIGCSSPPVPYFMNTTREMGYDGLIFSKDTAMTSQIETCGSNMDYYVSCFPSIVYTSLEAAGSNEVLREFLENFEKEYGAFPTVESTYRAYDSCLAIEEAVKIAGSIEPTAIKDALNQVKIQGLQGMLDYTDGTREPIKEINRWIVVNGEVVRLDEWAESGAYDEYLATRKWKN